jgi:hypothetical protein
VAAADAALRAARGQAVPLGVSAGTAGAAAPEHAVQNAGAQWALGSLGGAIGNLAGAQLVAPLVNLASRQHAAVDPKAIVPDNIRNSMNDLQAGSGDKLREQVAQRQTEIAALNSNTNVGIGQAAFVAATAVRTTAQGDQALGFGGTVGVGLAVSAAAGAAIGASMGMNAALSTVPVPKLADLQNAKNEGRPLSSVSTDPLPLFYTKHMPALGPVAALSNAWTNSPLRDPTPGENPRAARQPQNLAQATSMVTSDVGNVAAAVANRTGRLASSTMTLALTSAATPLAAAAFSENPPAALATSVVGASVGIYSAIKPWFGNLAGGIAGTEGRVQTARQDAVNAAAARHAQAQQPAPDLEMGMVAGTGAGASQGGSSQPPRQAALR